ncbi:OsmC family protein [soil metagenome]
MPTVADTQRHEEARTAAGSSRDQRVAPAHAAPAPVVVTRETGLRFSAQVRTHRVVVDQPVRGGGNDSAPTPVELLSAALGACISLYVYQFLTARSLSTQGLGVEVDMLRGDGHAISGFVVRLTLPSGLDAHQRSLAERVAQSCPVHHVFSHAMDIAVQVAPE